MSGEIADQSILDSMRDLYPLARIAHAYASTEAGVGLEVIDGLEGFPAHLKSTAVNGVEIKIIDGSMRIRSRGTALGYLGNGELRDADGFIDTGDLVELRQGRYYFIGRRGGVINVGGLKVHPEEVEAVLNRHPSVRSSLVKGRKNPVTGAIVIADIVLREPIEQFAAGTANLRQDILESCRRSLPQHKVPAAIRFVPSLELSPAGKTARDHA
jgi:acyl-CoA synthetase (AMP-forming)/AMP-acid ligase II